MQEYKELKDDEFVQKKQCKYGNNCRYRWTCRYLHPDDKERDEAQAKADKPTQISRLVWGWVYGNNCCYRWSCRNLHTDDKERDEAYAKADKPTQISRYV